MDERPKVRAIDIMPVQVNGQPHFVVRDPLGLTERVLLLTAPAAMLVSLMDGTRTLREVQVDFWRQTGVLVMSDQIEALVRQLDECLLLDNERFQDALEQAKRAYREGAVRPAALAGSVYPDDAEALRAMLDSFFVAPDGPGKPDGIRYERPLRAIVVPHIDLQRGGVTYAWAYRDLAEAPLPSLFVILGIAHQPTEHLFAATTKDFATPLGIARTDQEFLTTLAKRCPFDLFADEFAHRQEHSVELQVIWLQHLFGQVRIVPILCAGFENLLPAGQSPMTLSEVAGFVEALRATLREFGEPVTFIVSVDLSHVGLRFGDRQPVTAQTLRWLQTQDRRFLQLVADGDAEGSIALLQREGNARRVDAYPAVYVALKVLGETKGLIRHYGQSVEGRGESVVTFGAVTLP
jgi:AmmeMemoRadiSam system protein B